MRAAPAWEGYRPAATRMVSSTFAVSFPIS
ncbi:MAG: hypothetical protein K0R83_1940, partial [Caulobacter sp.]|nr:hypothetical protein [Caulobacter sp.]